jgi:predicted nucleic acid-binding protein
MSGKRLLLDTNAIVALLQGNQRLIEATKDSGWMGISIISHIELLCFSGITDRDRDLFSSLSKRVELIGLHIGEPELIDRAIEIRRSSRIKLPDAIVVASALMRDAVLVTADAQLSKIGNLVTLSF